jgi:hypothetical protein
MIFIRVILDSLSCAQIKTGLKRKMRINKKMLKKRGCLLESPVT